MHSERPLHIAKSLCNGLYEYLEGFFMNRRISSKDTIWIYGKHAVKAAILNEKREVLRLIFLESCRNFLNEIEHSRKFLNAEVVDRNFFASIFGKNAIHQGCAVLVKNLYDFSIEDVIEDESDHRPIVFLDQITDPQNIGSILRASAAFGARAVVTTENHSPEITPAVAKAASGALETIPLIRVVNLAHTVNFLKKHGFWVIGLDERSDKVLDEIKLDGKFIFIIGSEGNGMRRLSREVCDFLVRLPIFGIFTTLNAAQAATVSLYESLRQRIKNV
jgi:23S rRNA (guanosine2251-2'-O)-methyltransferase